MTIRLSGGDDYADDDHEHDDNDNHLCHDVSAKFSTIHVVKRIDAYCIFIIQSSGYIFGAHTKRHPLSIGDRVLALADPGIYLDSVFR